MSWNNKSSLYWHPQLLVGLWLLKMIDIAMVLSYDFVQLKARQLKAYKTDKANDFL